MNIPNERRDFILAYIAENNGTDVCDQIFHEQYHERFPNYKVCRKMFGAEPVPQAQRDLKSLFDEGVLLRGRIGLPFAGPGFPKWVWSYYLPQQETPND